MKPVSDLLPDFSAHLRRRAEDYELAAERCAAAGKNQAAAVMSRRAAEFRRFADRAADQYRGVGQRPTADAVLAYEAGLGIAAPAPSASPAPSRSSENVFAPVGQGTAA